MGKLKVFFVFLLRNLLLLFWMLLWDDQEVLFRGRWDSRGKLMRAHNADKEMGAQEKSLKTSLTSEHVVFLLFYFWSVSSTCISPKNLKIYNFYSVSLNPDCCLLKTNQIVRIPD